MRAEDKSRDEMLNFCFFDEMHELSNSGEEKTPKMCTNLAPAPGPASGCRRGWVWSVKERSVTECGWFQYRGVRGE